MKRAMMLLIIAIIGFIFVRSLIVPATFGQYGWYRGDSVNDNRNFEIGYAGSITAEKKTVISQFIRYGLIPGIKQ
jgi:hypothetical protein